LANPQARAIAWSSRSLRFWKSGHPIPEEATEKISDAGALAAHRVAQRVVVDLMRVGLLKEYEAVKRAFEASRRSQFKVPKLLH
jgi:hypothetical protein